MRITCHTHYFIVDELTGSGRELLLKYATRLVQFSYTRDKGRTSLAPVRTFASSTHDREQFRFHIHLLDELLTYLDRAHITSNLINLLQKEIYTPTRYYIKIKDGWIPREHQIPAIEYIKNTTKNRSKLVPIQTGKGKTLVALFAIADLGYRTLAILKPGYILKWVEDIKKTIDCDVDDIMTVQGSDQLRGLLDLQANGQLKSKFILISNRTYQNWIKAYENDRFSIKDMGYPCNPDEIFEYLDIGIRLIDEVHQDFHLNFKLDLYTNVPVSISLSATLLSHDPFMERMYEIAYPKRLRHNAGELDKYIDAIAVDYEIDKKYKVQTTEYGSTMYSHHAFEKSILKQPKLMLAYFNMISDILEEGYIVDYKPTEKAIVYCISIDMIDALTEYLKKSIRSFQSLDI